MVKIIGESKAHVKQVDCPKCAASLEYTEIDTKERHGRDIGGGPDGCKWIDCPRCNNKVILKSW